MPDIRPLMITVLLLTGGCATLSRPDYTEYDLRQPDGYAAVRFDAADAEAGRLWLARIPQAGDDPAFDLLALSGGGASGAFGAGVLVGWTDTGTRPEFDIVTGISSGALAAPFAFLGSAWDTRLQTRSPVRTPVECWAPSISVSRCQACFQPGRWSAWLKLRSIFLCCVWSLRNIGAAAGWWSRRPISTRSRRLCGTWGDRSGRR